MYDATPPPRLAPGGLVLGGLGLAAFVVSLLAPWLHTVRFDTTSDSTTVTDAFDFGVGSVLYVVGVVLVAGFAVATLLTRGVTRTVVGATGLACLVLPAAALFTVAVEISLAGRRALERAAAIDRNSDPDIFAALQAGPILGALAVFLLAVALTRFTWPAWPTGSYAVAGSVACVLALVVPWAERDAIFADRVSVQSYWFSYFGVLGGVGAFAAFVALAAAVLAVALGPRAWWPPLPAMACAVAIVVATGMVDGDHFVTDPRLADATYVDDVVNSGLPTTSGLVAFVMFGCALVSGIIQYRRARRAAPARPMFLPQR